MDCGQGNYVILIITKLLYGLGNPNKGRMDVKTRKDIVEREKVEKSVD